MIIFMIFRLRTTNLHICQGMNFLKSLVILPGTVTKLFSLYGLIWISLFMGLGIRIYSGISHQKGLAFALYRKR